MSTCECGRDGLILQCMYMCISCATSEAMGEPLSRANSRQVFLALLGTAGLLVHVKQSPSVLICHDSSGEASCPGSGGELGAACKVLQGWRM
jgi:hypothetical protein